MSPGVVSSFAVDMMESVQGAVATGSQPSENIVFKDVTPVATAPGTDLTLKLRRYRSPEVVDCV